jgi:hypothetical protein
LVDEFSLTVKDAPNAVGFGMQTLSGKGTIGTR